MDTTTGWGVGDEGRDGFGVEPGPIAPLGSSVAPMPGGVPDARAAYHYRTEQELALGELAALSAVLRPHAASLPDATVCFVRATSREGMAVRVEPRAAPDVLYLDFTDFASLKAGLDVPGLDMAVRTLRAHKARR